MPALSRKKNKLGKRTQARARPARSRSKSPRPAPVRTLKRAENELRRTAAYLAEGERIGHMGSWAVKIPSGEVFWSDGMFGIYQLDRATTKVSNPEVFKIIHPQDRRSVREAFERAVREKGDYEMRHRAILPDGALKYFHSLGRPVLNASGELLEYLGMVVDVTEQTQTERLLREANEKVEMILDSMTDRFFAVDKEWRYTYFNSPAEEQLRALGKDPESLIGKVLWNEFPNSPAEKHLRRAMRERLVLSCEHFYPPLGEWVENRMYPMPDGGLAMYVRYITDQKRAEEELHTTRAELAHALRVSMMGEMAASIAHEINQPLGAIVNNSNVCLQLVRKTGSVKKRREVLLDILNDAKRASAIINRIRALTKRSKPKKTSLSVKKLVIDVLAHADYAAVKAEVTIKTSVRTQLRVSGDQIQLQQMLLNLVMNGIEAMSDVDKKERTLSIRVKRGEVEGKPAAVISVQDGGPGLETKEVDRFFQPFFTTKRDGMGMGLGISRTIAEANGGRLWAIPNKAPGATFCCALPIEMETA